MSTYHEAEAERVMLSEAANDAYRAYVTLCERLGTDSGERQARSWRAWQEANAAEDRAHFRCLKLLCERRT